MQTVAYQPTSLVNLKWSFSWNTKDPSSAHGGNLEASANIWLWIEVRKVKYMEGLMWKVFFQKYLQHIQMYINEKNKRLGRSIFF